MYQKIGHIGTYMHMSSQWTTCIGGFSFDLNHWPYVGTWAYTETEVHNEQPVSEFIGMYQTIGLMGNMGRYRHMSA